MHGFQKNFAQLVSFRKRSAVQNICLRRLKVKVKLEGQMILRESSRDKLVWACSSVHPSTPPTPPPCTPPPPQNKFFFRFGFFVEKIRLLYPPPPFPPPTPRGPLPLPLPHPRNRGYLTLRQPSGRRHNFFPSYFASNLMLSAYLLGMFLVGYKVCN